MGNWQPEIVAALLEDTPVAALVGTRVYLGAVPEPATRPYVLLTGSGGEELETSHGPVGLKLGVVELACVASTYIAAWALWALARGAIAVGPVAGYLAVVRTEKTEGPRDAPNVDGSADIFAVVGLYEIMYR